MKLHVADGLSLPAEAVTQTFGVLAKRGVGKTYTASVMAEEMLKAKQQVVAIDPTGAWWGLRSGFPIVVLGGDHGDLPLEEHAGEVIASAVVENRFSAILDFSLFRKGQLIRFMVGFAEALYRLNREPLHLFVDEADAVAPQGRSFGGDENRMLGAMEDIVRRGRKRGLGCTLITQRPAVINKNVLTQCESLFAMRLVHPRDIDAVTEWINVHADPEQAQEVVDSLPTLAVGEAWFWSPGWLNVLKRVNVRVRETFDSSATPKPGETVRTPKQLAALDLDALGEQIRSTAEKAKENDPRELKKRIAELERQLRERPAAEPRIVEVPVLSNGQLESTHRLLDGLKEVAEKVTAAGGDLARVIAERTQARPQIVSPDRIPAPGYATAPQRPRPAAQPPTVPTAGAGDLGRGERSILTAAAQYPAGVGRDQLAVLTGYKRSSRNTYLQRLQGMGYVEQSGDLIVATAEGVAALGSSFEPLPTGDALRSYWLARLPEGERRILEVLIEHHPHAVDRDSLDDATGYKRSSRNTYLQRLTSRRLVVVSGRNEVRASDELF